jgi:hypothetical protein
LVRLVYLVVEVVVALVMVELAEDQALVVEEMVDIILAPYWQQPQELMELAVVAVVAVINNHQLTVVTAEMELLLSHTHLDEFIVSY